MVEPVLLLLAALASLAPDDAILPATTPRIIDTLPCHGPADEIVVCGRRPGEEPYRIPTALREAPLTAENYSWSARARDEREASRYGSLAVGPGGAFNRSWQVDCEWRAERQELAGHMPDCTRRVRARQPE